MNFHLYLFHIRDSLLSCGVRNGIKCALIFTALVSVKLTLEEGILFAVFIFTIL